MRELGVLEAKTNFSGLLDELAKGGEDVVITRHGQPVAVLSAHKTVRRQRRQAAVDDINALREELARKYPDAPTVSWEELIEEARR